MEKFLSKGKKGGERKCKNTVRVEKENTRCFSVAVEMRCNIKTESEKKAAEIPPSNGGEDRRGSHGGTQG